jgi:hypothetical protein
MRQDLFPDLGEVPRQIEDWRCQEGLHPKTPEPPLVSPARATTGVRWTSLGGSIVPTATCEWRAWLAKPLASSCSCVSQSLRPAPFCILRLGVDYDSLHAQTQSPLSFLTGLCSMAHGSPINLPVRYKRPGCRSVPSTFSSVRKLRLWYPYNFDFGRPLFRVQLNHIRCSLHANSSNSSPSIFKQFKTHSL